jgi:5-methylcytosine-specific restriction endonuclease McrA
VDGTLLLNATFEPICVVPLRRAVLLVLAEKAEIITASTGEIHSEHLSVPIPSVVRLVHLARIPFRIRATPSRRTLMARDHGRCGYCGRPGDSMDHIVPRSRDGQHEWENVVLACRRCNVAKGNKLLSELGWTLRIKPYAPTSRAWLIIAVGTMQPEWEPYLAAAAA